MGIDMSMLESLIAENLAVSELANAQRRYRRLFLPIGFLETFLCGESRIFAGIPRGGKILRVWYDDERDRIGVVVCHPTFETIPPGNVLPIDESVMVEYVPPFGDKL